MLGIVVLSIILLMRVWELKFDRHLKVPRCAFIAVVQPEGLLCCCYKSPKGLLLPMWQPKAAYAVDPP